jgi:acetyl esterase
VIIVTHPSFEPEARAFLDRVGTQAGPLTHDDLIRGRGLPVDPELAGTPEPVRARADVLLPFHDRTVRVRVYRPDTSSPRPLLLWLHGGGFVSGTLDDVDVTCSRIAFGAGVVVVSLEYRLAPEHPYPAALQDTMETLGWLAEHGELFGGDGRVAAGGQSSGANLVAAAALKARDSGGHAPARQVLCYPALDFEMRSESHRQYDGVLLSRSRLEWNHLQYLAGQPVTPYVAPLTSPDLSGIAPALILSAGRDPLRDDARRYAERLRDSGVDVRHLEYEATPHAFLNFAGAFTAARRAAEDIAEDLVAFFRLPSGDATRASGRLGRQVDLSGGRRGSGSPRS